MSALTYDLALSCTSVAFGAGAWLHRHTAWQLVVYSAIASVLFRVHRCASGRAGVPMPAHPLYMHDLACATLALVATTRFNPSTSVRTWIGRGIALFIASHVLTALGRMDEARMAHAAAHVCIVAGAWSR